MVAELLDLPCVTAISKLELEGGKGVAEREIEGGVEVVEFALPAVLTAEKGLNTPRYPALKGIMAAKKKPIDEKPAALGESRVAVTTLGAAARAEGGAHRGRGPGRGARAGAAAPRGSEGALMADDACRDRAARRRAAEGQPRGGVGRAAARADATGWDGGRVGARGARRGCGRGAAWAEVGADRVLVAERRQLREVRARRLRGHGGRAWSRRASYGAVLVAATAAGKDLAPRIAARLDAPLATDVTGVAVAGGKVTRHAAGVRGQGDPADQVRRRARGRGLAAAQQLRARERGQERRGVEGAGGSRRAGRGDAR